MFNKKKSRIIRRKMNTLISSEEKRMLSEVAKIMWEQVNDLSVKMYESLFTECVYIWAKTHGRRI